VNAQHIRVGLPFAYDGGTTPLEHPHAAQAAECAIAVYRALPGLVGYVGVDLVLTEAGPVVTDVNPRLTTAYLGVRAALDANIAALALEASLGQLPPPPGPPRRRVRFTADGVVTCEEGRPAASAPTAAEREEAR
jgi:predicted ATP-grasp superfamily ATP-dependent carboligase